MRPALGLVGLLAACGGDAAPVRAGEIDRGRLRFETLCAPCHLADGAGVEGGGPPLAASPWVSGPESRLIRIVLHGARGPFAVGGVTYDREMLGFGPVLTDEEVASVLTFVRARFGAPGPAVSPESVRAVRARTRGRTDYWTAAELLEIP